MPLERARGGVRAAQHDFVTGRLLAHGSAPYLHKQDEPLSYFVKLETNQGERTIWGVDLQRAFKESVSRPKAGDDIALRALRRDSVTVKALDRSLSGEVTARDVTTHRNRWEFETQQFVQSRANALSTLRDPLIAPQIAVGAHPELANSYLQLRAAEKLAEHKIAHPGDRRKFAALVREALAEKYERGEALVPMALRERGSREFQSAERELPAGR